MFEESLLTISNWQQLTHPDTRPDKGREHNNTQEWRKKEKKKKKQAEKIRGGGTKKSRKKETEAGNQIERIQ